ncbi:ricin-type beta-trefoil lectin domain protein [Streptomyces goshikiensis]|uniref:ricin-type beta-trefoil lectin domain protein n=1 Tax=Streptomyces goshikiensis TaxID=1942 RepID=UPI00366310F3
MSPFSANNFRLPVTRSARATRSRLARRTGVTLSVLLVVSLLPAQAWAAPPGDRSALELPALQKEPKAKLDQAAAAKLHGWAGAPVTPPAEYEPSQVSPPAAGSAEVALAPATGDQLVQVGSLPVAIGKASPTEENPAPPAPSGTWSVAVEARAATEAADVDGAIIKVTPPAQGSTPVDVQLDYKKFQDLYGTEWSTRLELKQLPACFLTTPDLPECTAATDVPSSNDPDKGTVRATIDPATAPSQGMRTMSGGGPVVLAASDGASGAGGTYKATSLSAAGNWSAGGSSGGFSWTYPLATPPPAAGPAPKIAFSYSSQAVDGRTSVANGQASWIGDGWDYHPGFIERRYRSCADDRKATPSKPNNDNTADKKKSDLCWAGDNVVMSLGGGSTELVHDATSGQWVPTSDDGTKVERKTDASVANGAKDGEYWVVTTRDGTKYQFGRHDVDGSGSRPVTNSVFTVPVFGNHPGEPCYQTSYASSSCTQAWRWNLDYVEDVHGNAMVIDWAKETNHYAKNQKFKEKVSYVRGGYPTAISYGLRASDLSGAPAGKVEFTVAERCVKQGSTTCSDAEFESKNYGDKQPWWDTPSTLHCKADAKNCFASAPTFWTRKRLTAVTTYGQRTEGSTALSLVDRWNLSQSFPEQRGDTHPPLWLESVTRTGYGTAKDANGNQQGTSLPPVSFLPNVEDMPNRVLKSTGDATPDFDRLRVETIRTETGSETYVDYSAPCTVGTTHPKPEENTTRCYPVHWSPDGELEKPPLEWFNKYVVERVVEKDRVARQPDVTTTYTYEGGAAWAKETDEFSKPELRTYNQWRGYAGVTMKQGVTAHTGESDATEQSQSLTRYFRGMSGDAGRAKITVKDSTDTESLGEDLPQFQGRVAETISYSKVGGSVVSRVLTWPWSHKTASRPRDGTTALEAYRSGVSRTDEVQAISGGASRMVRTNTEYDSTYGLPLTQQTTALTHNGTGWTTHEQKCITTTFVHNTDKNIIGLPQRVRSTAGDCTQAESGTVLADTRTSFDALNAFGTAPTKGLPFQIDTLDAAGTGWVTSARTEYDTLGRAVKAYDAAGTATSSTFSPPTGPVFTTTVTNALGHTATTKTDPARGSALETTDANGRKTTSAYDDLGRSTAVWTPSQNPAKDKAAYRVAYQISEHQPPVVTTSTLRDNGTYADSVAIYDGLLRLRQTQAEALGGGRLITDTFHSANGSVRQSNNGYYAEGEPDSKIFVPESVFRTPNSTKVAYDGLGRAVRVTTLYADVPQHSATTQYGGDWTVSRTGMSADGTTPLKGSQATKSWTDALNRTYLVQNATSTDLSTWTDTTYTYDVRGKLAKVTDAAGNKWTYDYDARGRMTASNDPDMGPASFGYNNLDQQTWSKDSAGRTQHTAYDVLGRKTELREDSPNGSLVASWTYDSLPNAKGQPVASTRYSGGAAFTSEVTGYDTEYRPTGSKTTIPDTAATKGLSGTYAYTTTYTATGKVQSTTVPATPGGLAAEQLIARYDGEGSPVTLSGLTWYTADTVYSPFGEVLRTASGTAPNRVWISNKYDPNNGRVTDTISDRETANPNRISALSYTYDTVGNPTSITDSQPGGRTDRQCFTYDPMGQLTEAWTGKTAACSGPTLTDVTPGPDGDGYWQSYQFDNIGNRTKIVKHDLTSPSLDDETTYTYGITNAANGTQPPITTQPHALAKAAETARTPGSTIASIATYGYDIAGNTKTRTIGGDTQTLNWDRRNKLTSATSPGIGAVALTGATGKCIDVDGANSADGTAIQLWTCNQTTAQQWRLTAETVRALDKCLTNDAGKLKLATCNGSPTQKFAFRPGDKSLYNPAANQCVDLPGGNDTNGTDLQLRPCSPGTSQEWSNSDTTTYLYDASGNRLIEDNGSTRTLYLGEAEVTANKAGQAIDAQRFYGNTVRTTFGKTTGHRLSVLLSDHHGTATTTIDQSGGQTVTRRKSDPYGNPRGTQPDSWPGRRGFLGVGIDDTTTGLTHIGAREYDPSTGRFISVDPVIDITDPRQMNGYTYSGGNPISGSDPSGLRSEECGTLYDCKHQSVITYSNYKETTSDYVAPAAQLRYYQTHLPTPSSGKKAQKQSKLSTLGHLVINAGKSYNESPLKAGSQFLYGSGAGLASLGDIVNPAGPFMRLAGVSGEGQYNWLMGKLGVDTTEVFYDLGEIFGPMPGVAAEAKALGRSGKSLEKAAAGCLTHNSFTPGTKVLLANGASKPMEDIAVGDEVLATDPENNETSSKTVTATIYTEDDKAFVDVTVETDDGAKVITTTDHHPFWSESEKKWLDAADLKPGTTLRTTEGKVAPVSRVRSYTFTNDTYNLTVADLHTYYVLAGATPVLVHNCSAGGKSGARLAQESGQSYEDHLVETLGGGGGFSEMGRQFDGAFIDSATGRGTWYEAKSGNFWENTLKNNRQSGFFSTEGQKFGIAKNRGIPYRVISENPIPSVFTNWFDKKGIPWEVRPRQAG